MRGIIRGGCSRRRWASRNPAAMPETNVINTTTTAIAAVFVELRGGGAAGGSGSLTDTVRISRHHDLDSVVAEGCVVVIQINRGDSDRGGEADRGQRERERPEPRREQLQHRGPLLLDALADADTDARQRERIGLVAERRRVAATAFEEFLVT